jgi:hypothetical protein
MEKKPVDGWDVVAGVVAANAAGSFACSDTMRRELPSIAERFQAKPLSTGLAFLSVTTAIGVAAGCGVHWARNLLSSSEKNPSSR